jgi:hypothetical protein
VNVLWKSEDADTAAFTPLPDPTAVTLTPFSELKLRGSRLLKRSPVAEETRSWEAEVDVEHVETAAPHCCGHNSACVASAIAPPPMRRYNHSKPSLILQLQNTNLFKLHRDAYNRENPRPVLYNLKGLQTRPPLQKPLPQAQSKQNYQSKVAKKGLVHTPLSSNLSAIS